MSPPSKEVRGDGLTFVFRLDGTATRAYRWAGGGDEHSEEGVQSSTVNQFLVCSEDYLAVGGGSAEGSNALRISADLSTCSAGPSDTFSNPPLAPEEALQPFMLGECSDLIVFD